MSDDTQSFSNRSFDTGGGLSVGERLTRIEARLFKVLDGLEHMARQTDYERLEARVQQLETEQAVVAALQKNRRVLIGLLIGAAGWASVLTAGATFWLSSHH